jgi:tryptophan 2,3-dioxygenase
VPRFSVSLRDVVHASRWSDATPSRRSGTPSCTTCPAKGTPSRRRILLSVYRDDTKNAELCERLVDLDEGIQEWRYRHVKMVERTIGVKRGTGGSSGAAYLRETVGRPLFPDLWEIRSQL